MQNNLADNIKTACNLAVNLL